MNEKEIKKLLGSKNLKITKNRVAILKCLTDGHHFHAISEIVDHVHINTKSIYDNIKLLINVGLVDAYAFGGVSKYALNDAINGDYNQIHLVNGENITHLEIKKGIFKQIKKEVESIGKKVNSIKIFVNID